MRFFGVGGAPGAGAAGHKGGGGAGPPPHLKNAPTKSGQIAFRYPDVPLGLGLERVARPALYFETGIISKLVTELFHNWDMELFIGAFCTISRARPVVMGPRAKFGGGTAKVWDFEGRAGVYPSSF